MLKLYLADYDKYFEQILLKHSFTDTMVHFTNLIILVTIVALIAIAANFILKLIIIKVIKRWVDKSENKYDDVFYEKGLFPWQVSQRLLFLSKRPQIFICL